MLDRETLEAALEGLIAQREKLEQRIQNVRDLLGELPQPPHQKKKRELTPEARQRIVEAQKRRWGKFRKGKGD